MIINSLDNLICLYNNGESTQIIDNQIKNINPSCKVNYFQLYDSSRFISIELNESIVYKKDILYTKNNDWFSLTDGLCQALNFSLLNHLEYFFCLKNNLIINKNIVSIINNALNKKPDINCLILGYDEISSIKTTDVIFKPNTLIKNIDGFLIDGKQIMNIIDVLNDTNTIYTWNSWFDKINNVYCLKNKVLDKVC